MRRFGGRVLHRTLILRRARILAVVGEVIRVRVGDDLPEPVLAGQPMKEHFDQTQVRVDCRKAHAPGPGPPAATLGDVQLSQTLKGLSAREREVSPTPFIPTRRVVVRHSPCTPWQPVRLGPKRGLPSLDTPRQGPLAVCPCTLSGISDRLVEARLSEDR